MKHIFKKGWKSFATVVLLVGLVGGPAYAAGLAANSVKSKHIKDGEVKTLDILDETIAAADLGLGSVGTAEVADGTVTGTDILDDGVSGDVNLIDGTVGTSSLTDGGVRDVDLASINVRTNSTTVNAGSASLVTAACDPGETALGGGGTWNGASTVGPVYLAQVDIGGTSGANGGPSQVTVTGRNDGGAARTLTAQVTCLA